MEKTYLELVVELEKLEKDYKGLLRTCEEYIRQQELAKQVAKDFKKENDMLRDNLKAVNEVNLFLREQLGDIVR